MQHQEREADVPGEGQPEEVFRTTPEWGESRSAEGLGGKPPNNKTALIVGDFVKTAGTAFGLTKLKI